MEGIHQIEKKEFTPRQQEVLARLNDYKEGDSINDELRIGEVMNKNFLEAIAKIDIPVEIGLFESINGTARIITGFTNEAGTPAVGNKISGERMVRGQFNIHTHFANGDLHDLRPSAGDMFTFEKRSQHKATPSVILDGYGMSISGLNPFAKVFDNALREKYKDIKNSSNMDDIERGGWLTTKRTKLYEDAEFWILSRPGHKEDRAEILFWLANELGFILTGDSWDALTEEQISLAFNEDKATEFWRKKIGSELKKIEEGKCTPESLTKELDNTITEFRKRWKEKEHAYINFES